MNDMPTVYRGNGTVTVATGSSGFHAPRLTTPLPPALSGMSEIRAGNLGRMAGNLENWDGEVFRRRFAAVSAAGSRSFRCARLAHACKTPQVVKDQNSSREDTTACALCAGSSVERHDKKVFAEEQVRAEIVEVTMPRLGNRRKAARHEAQGARRMSDTALEMVQVCNLR